MVPRVPISVRAQAEPSAKPGMLDGPCLSEAPMGWAAFGSQERAVWVRTLENGVWAAASHRVLLQGPGIMGRRAGEGAEPLVLGKAKSTWDLLPSQGCLPRGMWNYVMSLLSLNQPTELHCWRGVSGALPENILKS